MNDDHIYIDRQGMDGIGVIVRGKSVVYTGLCIHREPKQYRVHAYLETFAKEGFRFFFDDEEPSVQFYAVPAVLVVGYDGAGGYFMTTETDFSFRGHFPLYYLSPEKDVFIVAGGSTRFLTGEYRWEKELKPSDAVKIYASRSMAEHDFKIYDADAWNLPDC